MGATRILRVLLALLCLGIASFAAVVCAVCWRSGVQRDPAPSDCLIVLGARVKPNGILSDSLRYRCEAALQAYEDGLASNIIVSGAQGSDEPVAEATAMYDWLVSQGVPKERIFLESASYDTWENLQNSREIMLENGWQTAIVVTSDYHLERALWVARDLGISATGIASESPKPFGIWLRNRMREACSWGVYALKKVF